MAGQLDAQRCNLAPDDGPIPRTLKFVRAKLSAWRDDPKRTQAITEKALNSSLCTFLDVCARNELPMARFTHEFPQGKSHSVDIGVHGTEETTLIGAQLHSIYEPFLLIEAKRLPAPSKDRQCEYVTGTKKPKGGIQRFKLGHHGSDHDTAAIVGYIQEHTAEHWYSTINSWIDELADKKNHAEGTWTKSEQLHGFEYDAKSCTSTANSNHQRIERCRSRSIRLHHLWVVMQTQATSSKSKK